MSAGDLDPSFGSGGFVLTSPVVENSKVGYSFDEARAVNILADGKILVGGGAKHPDYDFGLVRLTKDGALDTSFGTGGRVVTDFGSRDYMRDMVVYPDGHIVVVGEVLTTSGTKKNPVSDWDFGLARYIANGTLDTTFNNSGIVTTSIGAVGMEDNPAAVALQSDGKIVVAGTTQTGPDSYNSLDLALVRYNANGSLDTSFGGTGKVVYQVSAVEDTVKGLAIQGDGKILVAGWSSDSSGTGPVTDYLARFTNSGALDTGFGTSGVARLPTPQFEDSAMALQPDGNIVIAGQFDGTDTDIALARLLPTGVLDTSLGGTGFVSASLGNDQQSQDVAIQGDGKIVVVGTNFVSGGTSASGDSLVARFTSNGSLDPNFGVGGFSIKSFSTGDYDSLNAVALQADGSIVAVGRAFVTRSSRVRDSDFLVARYLSDPIIGSFTANPNPVAAGSTVTLTAGNITTGNPASSIAQVAFYLDSNNDGRLEPGSDQLLGYASQTSPGIWTLTNSSAFGLTAGTYRLFAQAEDSDGIFSDPIALTLTVQ
jgi:uncharacterized delta-60 repeat protein